jgi:hypothetical protein
VILQFSLQFTVYSLQFSRDRAPTEGWSGSELTFLLFNLQLAICNKYLAKPQAVLFITQHSAFITSPKTGIDD